MVKTDLLLPAQVPAGVEEYSRAARQADGEKKDPQLDALSSCYDQIRRVLGHQTMLGECL